MLLQCRWCGQFVLKDTERTTRAIKGAGGKWRNVSQMLCPQHARDWSIDLGWNREADPDLEVEELT